MGEQQVFEDRYEITVLDSLTTHTTHHSWLVYKLIPVVGTGVKDRRFVALFAREEDAYDYVAVQTAVDAGLNVGRLIADMREDGKESDEAVTE